MPMRSNLSTAIAHAADFQPVIVVFDRRGHAAPQASLSRTCP